MSLERSKREIGSSCRHMWVNSTTSWRRRKVVSSHTPIPEVRVLASVSSSSGNKLFFTVYSNFTMFLQHYLRANFFCNGCKHLHAWRLCSVWMNDNDGGYLSDRWVTVVLGNCVSSVHLIIHYIIVSVGCFIRRWTRLGREPPTSPSSKQRSTGWGRCSWSRWNTEVVFPPLLSQYTCCI